MGFCNVYLAVDILREGRVQDQSKSFVLAVLGSVQRFRGVKEREYSLLSTIFEEVLVMRRSCDLN